MIMLMAIIPLASSILYHPEDARGLDGSEGKSQGKDKHINLKPASFFRHFEKNSRTKKLKTQEKNSITHGKNLRFGQALKILSM